MSHKIQIIVDDRFDKTIRSGARKMGLSVSSYARLVLTSALLRKNNKLLDQAIQDLRNNETESLTLEQFNRQLEDL